MAFRSVQLCPTSALAVQSRMSAAAYDDMRLVDDFFEAMDETDPPGVGAPQQAPAAVKVCRARLHFSGRIILMLILVLCLVVVLISRLWPRLPMRSRRFESN